MVTRFPKSSYPYVHVYRSTPEAPSTTSVSVRTRFNMSYENSLVAPRGSVVDNTFPAGSNTAVVSPRVASPPSNGSTCFTPRFRSSNTNPVVNPRRDVRDTRFPTLSYVNDSDGDRVSPEHDIQRSPHEPLSNCQGLDQRRMLPTPMPVGTGRTSTHKQHD